LSAGEEDAGPHAITSAYWLSANHCYAAEAAMSTLDFNAAVDAIG
jgi:hypothetical protein